MKSIFFLPAVAIASSKWGGGNIGKDYAQDYTIEDNGDGFQCDIDGNATYNFKITSGNGYIRGAAAADGKSCTQSVDIAADGLSAEATLNNDCFDHSLASGHTGKVDIFISAAKDKDLYFGKVWQNMTCTMKRDHSVTYNFTQIMLDTENEGPLSDGGENGYILSRVNANFTSNMTSDTHNVTSGEQLWFQINSKGDYKKFDFDVKKCTVSKGNESTYNLADFYNRKARANNNGTDVCQDTFLATVFGKDREHGVWRFTYEAFTFQTDNQSDVALTCDIFACKDENSMASGFCEDLGLCEDAIHLRGHVANQADNMQGDGFSFQSPFGGLAVNWGK